MRIHHFPYWAQFCLSSNEGCLNEISNADFEDWECLSGDVGSSISLGYACHLSSPGSRDCLIMGSHMIISSQQE